MCYVYGSNMPKHRRNARSLKFICTAHPLCHFSINDIIQLVVRSFASLSLLPDVVWPAAAKRQPRARSARRGSCRPTNGPQMGHKWAANGPQMGRKWATNGPQRQAISLSLSLSLLREHRRCCARRAMRAW